MRYKHGAFLEDLKKLYELTGVKNQKLTFLFSDTEIVEESFLEDVANMLSSGEVPNLFTGDELSTVRSGLEKAGKATGLSIEDVLGLTVAAILSRSLADSHGSEDVRCRKPR